MLVIETSLHIALFRFHSSSGNVIRPFAVLMLRLHTVITGPYKVKELI